MDGRAVVDAGARDASRSLVAGYLPWPFPPHMVPLTDAQLGRAVRVTLRERAVALRSPGRKRGAVVPDFFADLLQVLARG